MLKRPRTEGQDYAVATFDALSEGRGDEIGVRRNDRSDYIIDTGDRNSLPADINNTAVGGVRRYTTQPFNSTQGFSVGVLSAGPVFFNHWCLKRVCFNWTIPNVNVNNNTVTFQSSLHVGTNFLVTLPPNYYTYASLAAELQTQLNSVTGSSGLTWTVTTNPDGTTYNFATAGGSFIFTVDASAGTFNRIGIYVLPLPFSQVFSASKNSGFFLGQYTRQVQILCRELSMGKLSDTTTYRGGVHLVAVMCICHDQTAPTRQLFMREEHIPVWHHFDRSIALQSISLRVEDEFGNPLPGTDNADGALYNGDFLVDLILEQS